MGAQESQILATIEHLTLDATQDLAALLECNKLSVRQEELRPVPTGLMSIYTGCADIW